MKNKLIYLLCLLILFSVNAKAYSDPPIKDGKAIFNTRCASCHNVNKVLTGPALAGVDERYSIDWIVNFVHSSQTMVKKGDKAAVAVFEKFNKIPMPDHTDLSEENIKNIVEYIKSETGSNNQNSAPFAKPTKLKPNLSPISLSRDAWPLIGLLISILGLVVTLIFAVKVNGMMKQMKLKKANLN